MPPTGQPGETGTQDQPYRVMTLPDGQFAVIGDENAYWRDRKAEDDRALKQMEAETESLLLELEQIVEPVEQLEAIDPNHPLLDKPFTQRTRAEMRRVVRLHHLRAPRRIGRARSREHRPTATRRRTSSSSRTSGTDPGDPDGSEPPRRSPAESGLLVVLRRHPRYGRVRRDHLPLTGSRSRGWSE